MDSAILTEQEALGQLAVQQVRAHRLNHSISTDRLRNAEELLFGENPDMQLVTYLVDRSDREMLATELHFMALERRSEVSLFLRAEGLIANEQFDQAMELLLA